MHFLGVDFGGTKGRYAFWPPGGPPGALVRSAQPAVHGIDATVEALAAALQQALAAAPAKAAIAAVAGVGDRRVSEALLDGLRARGLQLPLAIIGDVLAAAAAGLREGPGVLVWSGTGSFVLVRDAAGALRRVGGRGYLLGDQGSGYDLVRRAAAAALAAVDGLGPATELTPLLTEAFLAPFPARLGAVLQGLGSGAVAAQLPVVLRAAAAGDAVAQQVLAEGVAALQQQVAVALRLAGMQPAGLPLVFGGGVLAAAAEYRAALAARLQSLGLQPPLLLADEAAAAGAGWLAHASYHGDEPGTGWVHHVAV